MVFPKVLRLTWCRTRNIVRYRTSQKRPRADVARPAGLPLLRCARVVSGEPGHPLFEKGLEMDFSFAKKNIVLQKLPRHVVCRMKIVSDRRAWICVADKKRRNNTAL